MKNIIISGTHGLGHAIAKKLQSLGEETFAVGHSYDEAKHGDGLKIDLSEAKEAQTLANKVKEVKELLLSASIGCLAVATMVISQNKSRLRIW